ncbi:hypothetical protein NC652_018080 [Populus alba x Populus x berolinensis]|nr:hypothetical protein NC652_018080 [Populus alba x Populus x berolinensis]
MYVLLDGHYIIIQKRKCLVFSLRFLLLETDTEHLLILWICCIFQGSDKLRQDRFFFFLQVMRFHFQNSKVQTLLLHAFDILVFFPISMSNLVSKHVSFICIKRNRSRGYWMPLQILVIYSQGAVPVTLKQSSSYDTCIYRALQAYDKLDRNLFTLHTLHIHFICRTKLQLQSKTLIQSQMVESSMHSCVVWINQTPDIHIKPGIRLNQLKVFHIFYLESARSLEDEGLRRTTVLMNFSPTKLDHDDVYGLKGRLQGFNWLFATRYMVNAVGNYYFSFCLCLNRTSCRN